MRDRSWWIRAVSPPIAVGAVIAISAVGLPANASAPELSPKTAQQVIALLANASVSGLSGDVVEKSALGLPSLPSGGGRSTAAGLTGLLTGTHSLRVWVGKAGQFRAQVLDTLDETEVVSDGTTLWTYVYSTNSVSRMILPAQHQASTSKLSTSKPSPAVASLTPDQAATKVLSAIDPSTEVTVSGTASIAGHDAYLLDVRPRTADTTIGVIRIGVDATTGVALRVQIFARGATSAALAIGFTHVSFGTVDASRFHFTPPPGAKNTQGGPSIVTGRGNGSEKPSPATPPATVPQNTSSTQPRIVGTGWASVVVLPHGALMTSMPDQPQGTERRYRAPGPNLADLVAKAGTRVTGGTLLHTALINVLVADDGRVLVGAVPASVLQKALTAPAQTG
jgi:outer membrane lipoprotein-sorting protein